MNPKKASKDLKEKILELNEIYTLGLSATEVLNCSYFKQLEELYQKEIKSFEEIKKLTPYLDFKKAHHYADGKGNVKIVSGQDYMTTMMVTEIEIQQKRDFLSMVHNDAKAGVEANVELVEYKKKLNK